jgi:hypothetical protein
MIPQLNQSPYLVCGFHSQGSDASTTSLELVSFPYWISHIAWLWWPPIIGTTSSTFGDSNFFLLSSPLFSWLLARKGFLALCFPLKLWFYATIQCPNHYIRIQSKQMNDWGPMHLIHCSKHVLSSSLNKTWWLSSILHLLLNQTQYTLLMMLYPMNTTF